MFILQGISLFQIYLSAVSSTTSTRKYWYDQKADTGTGKTCLKFVEPSFAIW